MSAINTESIIKETARKLFQEKGYAGTKTRDIAEAAGINLALLNYYFRSKKKLYDMIMMETIHDFFSKIIPIINDEDTSFREKIERFVERYIDTLRDNPDVPAFIINEVRQDPEGFATKLGILEKAKQSVFLRQFMEAIQLGEIPPINPLHFVINLSSLVVFPFLAMPMVRTITGVSADQYSEMLEERKQLIPLWVDAMLKVS